MTEAFNIVVNSNKITDKDKVKVIQKMSEYAGFYGMVGGQYVDMESENKKVGVETLEYIHNHKTGKLLLASVELPLIVLNVEGVKKEKLLEFAEIIGIAFQIKDDILDVEGSFEETGKESTDEKNEKTTYPSLFGLEKTKEMLNGYVEKAKKIIENNFLENKNKELLLKLLEYFVDRKL